MPAYNIYLGKKLIDKVFYINDGRTIEQIKKSLVEHDGYDPNITVTKEKRKPCTITLKQWYKKYDKKAAKQGWCLMANTNDDTIDIARIDDQGGCINSGKQREKYLAAHTQLKSDHQAFSVVFSNAANGCIMSLLAIWLDGKTFVPNGNKQHFVPEFILEGRTSM